jgi:hypothetical protein
MNELVMKNTNGMDDVLTWMHYIKVKDPRKGRMQLTHDETVRVCQRWRTAVWWNASDLNPMPLRVDQMKRVATMVAAMAAGMVEDQNRQGHQSPPRR